MTMGTGVVENDNFQYFHSPFLQKHKAKIIIWYYLVSRRLLNDPIIRELE